MKRKTTRYAPCQLECRTATTLVQTTTWLPARFARVGQVVTLREVDGTWSRDWTVCSAGRSSDCPPDVHRMIKGHRKLTGDAMPRRGGS